MNRPIIVFGGLGVTIDHDNIIHGEIMQFAESLYAQGYAPHIVSNEEDTVSALQAFQEEAPNVKISTKGDLTKQLFTEDQKMQLVCDAAPFWFDAPTGLEEGGRIIKPDYGTDPSQIIRYVSSALKL